MHRADAFEDEVDAYPAITVLRHAGQDQGIVATAGQNNEEVKTEVLADVLSGRTSRPISGLYATQVATWCTGDSP